MFSSLTLTEPNCDESQENSFNKNGQLSEMNNYDGNFNYSNIKVTVGIDEDLKMILEMDPSIVDLCSDIIGCTPANLARPDARKIGLPPISGGYVDWYIF